MAAHQAALSLGFSRQEHWSGLPFPSPMHESFSLFVKVKSLSRVQPSDINVCPLLNTIIYHYWKCPSIPKYFNLLQYSCLENSMDRGAWQAAVPGVKKSGTPEHARARYSWKLGGKCPFSPPPFLEATPVQRQKHSMVKQFIWGMRQPVSEPRLELGTHLACGLCCYSTHVTTGSWAVCHSRNSSPQEIFVNNKDPWRVRWKKDGQLWPSTFPGNQECCQERN